MYNAWYNTSISVVPRPLLAYSCGEKSAEFSPQLRDEISESPENEAIPVYKIHAVPIDPIYYHLCA